MKNLAALLGRSQNRPRPDDNAGAQRLAVKLRTPDARRPQAGVGRIALAEFEQAIAETDPRQGIVGICRQRAPEQLGRLRVVALVHQHRGQSVDRLGVEGIDRQRPRESAAGIGAVVDGIADETQLDRHFGHHRRHRDALLEHFDGFVGPIQRMQHIAELVKCRRERRRSLDGALEPEQGLVGVAGLAQGDGELRFDLRVAAGARRLFERRHGVLGFALHQQRVA